MKFNLMRSSKMHMKCRITRGGDGSSQNHEMSCYVGRLMDGQKKL